MAKLTIDDLELTVTNPAKWLYEKQYDANGNYTHSVWTCRVQGFYWGKKRQPEFGDQLLKHSGPATYDELNWTNLTTTALQAQQQEDGSIAFNFSFEASNLEDNKSHQFRLNEEVKKPAAQEPKSQEKKSKKKKTVAT